MTVSGTTAFNLDFAEIAEEAFERCGKEMRTGYDLRTARRSMNLMTIEFQNRGINMWTIEEGTVNLEEGVATYDLPADTIDVLEHVIRTGSGATQTDINISRISVSTYATIPNKTSQGDLFRYGYSGSETTQRSPYGLCRIKALLALRIMCLSTGA